MNLFFIVQFPFKGDWTLNRGVAVYWGQVSGTFAPDKKHIGTSNYIFRDKGGYMKIHKPFIEGQPIESLSYTEFGIYSLKENQVEFIPANRFFSDAVKQMDFSEMYTWINLPDNNYELRQVSTTRNGRIEPAAEKKSLNMCNRITDMQRIASLLKVVDAFEKKYGNRISYR